MKTENFNAQKRVAFSFLLGLFILVNVFAFAEPDGGKVKGKVIDSKTSSGMEYANIALYMISDSSLVTGTITDSNGDFVLDNIPEGKYYLTANFIGYSKNNIENIKFEHRNDVLELEPITLEIANTSIDQATIALDKRPVEYKLDKKVVNVSQQVTATGGTAANVLENAPSVNVDIEGNVTMRGSSSFTVLIDGKPSVMDGNDILQQIPASSIDNIEIITNPSAKYDPDGMAGIINIITKKKSLTGFSGIMNVSAGTGEKYRGDILFNYKTKNVNFFVGADVNHDLFRGSIESKKYNYFEDSTNLINSSTERSYLRERYNFKAGMDIYINNSTTWSIGGDVGKSGRERAGTSRIYDGIIETRDYEYSINDNKTLAAGDYIELNSTLQKQFNTSGHEIIAFAYYSEGQGDDIEEQYDYAADASFTILEGLTPELRSTSELGNEKEFRFKTDYTLPLGSGAKFEAGYQVRVDQEYEKYLLSDFDPDQSMWIENEEFTNFIDFNRQIHSVYSTFGHQQNKLNYQLGLRTEYTNRTIGAKEAEDPYTIKRPDFFPTLHLSRDLGEDYQLMTSYTRRIERPSGRMLEPFKNFYNEYTQRQGNPELEPEYINSYELGIQRRLPEYSFVSFELYHRTALNKITRIQSNYLDEESGKYMTLMSYDNLNKDFSTGSEVMANLNLTDWLTINTSANLFHYMLNGEINGRDVNEKSINWNYKLNTVFKFKDDSRIQLDLYYNGPSVTAQGEREGFFVTSAAARKDFFNKKLTASLSIRDILATAKYRFYSVEDNFRNELTFNRESQVISLNLAYKINNYKSREDEGGMNGSPDGGMGNDF